MREENHELHEDRELHRTALNKEEQAAEDRGVDIKSDSELEQEKKLIESMDQPDSFEY